MLLYPKLHTNKRYFCSACIVHATLEHMSNTHWKSTMVARMDLAHVLSPLVELAKTRNKVVTIFDIEATTFLGRPNFGITEIGMLHINPKGQLATSGSFVNPENRISQDASTLTGITQAMVKDSPTWGEGWGEAWSLIARDHLVVGYNSATFDGPALASQHRRYDQPELVFADHLDAFKFHKKAHGTNKGKLGEVAKWLGIDTSSFEGHRATNDAVMTALVMSALWERFPNHRVDAVAKPKADTQPLARRAVANPVGSYRRGAAAPAPVLQSINQTGIATAPRVAAVASPKLNITEHVVPYFANKNTFGHSDLEALATLMAPDHPEPTKLHQAISFEISRCLDKQMIGLLEPENEQKKEALKNSSLTEELKKMWTTTPRLAPIFEYVRNQVPTAADLNYIDLRWMLDFHGVRPVTPPSSGPGM